ncbi:hypothetical protein FFF34_015380 [Inquilinus sp. KBS0705]|nr:hypothetical protein FFF34_015380 [Inquilinus sp. KBS0705]
MRRFLPLVVVLLVFINGCKKDTPDLNGYKPADHTYDNSYMPLSKGSTWNYTSGSGEQMVKTSLTLTGDSTTINNRTYKLMLNKTTGAPDKTQYYYNAQHLYSVSENAGGVSLEYFCLNDQLFTGNTWNAKLTPTGLVNGVPGRISGQVVERNVTKIVLGKTYIYVIHTRLSVQYDYSHTGEYKEYGSYDYYFAKGVGIIQSNVTLGGITKTSMLTDYTIQ